MSYTLGIKIIISTIVFECKRYLILFEREYVCCREKKKNKFTSWISEKPRRRLGVKPICLVLRVLIRNQFLAHACCRLRIFNDANLVAQHDMPTKKRSISARLYTFTHTHSHTHTRYICVHMIYSRYLVFLLRQLIRTKFGLQIGKIEREIKQIKRRARTGLRVVFAVRS